MKKNIASQKIGAQLVSATDGSAFTGSVTVYVTGDAGTQAAGSVGSGACTHEGNGYHTYAPAQAETNYDLVAFTFIGTGAVPVTLQVFTRPSGDYATQTSVDTIDGIVDTILLDTTELQTDWVDGGRLDLLVDTLIATSAKIDDTLEDDAGTWRFTLNALEEAPSGGLDAAGVRAAVGLASADLDTQLSTIDTVVDAVKVKTDQFVFTVANQVDSNALSGAGGLDAAGIRSAVGLASANLDTQLSTIDTVVDSILVDTAEIGAAGAGLTAVPWNASWDAEVQSECADALAALVIEGSLDLVEVMKVLLAFAAGKTDITGSTYTFRDQADTLNRISATVTAGERTAVTLNVT